MGDLRSDMESLDRLTDRMVKNRISDDLFPINKQPSSEEEFNIVVEFTFIAHAIKSARFMLGLEEQNGDVELLTPRARKAFVEWFETGSRADFVIRLENIYLSGGWRDPAWMNNARGLYTSFQGVLNSLLIQDSDGET